MFGRILRVTDSIILNQYKLSNYVVPKRNVQISVIGAASEIGSNLALLLKMNWKVKHLCLYDGDVRVKGIGMELAHIPVGPEVSSFSGDTDLGPSLRGSSIIVMTSRHSRRPGELREKMLATNAPAVQNLCRAMVDQNPEAFLAISTNPINSIIPFASAVLLKYGCYNPKKMFGITHIDTARSRTFVGSTLKMNPQHLYVPVIGGHSDETIIPLFSNISPNCHSLEPGQVDCLTRLVRKAGTEVVLQKKGTESATLAMAWSIHEFVSGLIDALCGSQVVLNCYTANPSFGTRYFAGPTTVGHCGIVQTCSNLSMNEYESDLLNAAAPILNRDVSQGEDYVRYMETIGK